MKKYTKILLILFVFSGKLVLACMPLGEETVMMGKYLGKGEAAMLEIHGIQSVYSENKYPEFGFFNRFQKYTFSTDSVVNRDNIDISSLKKGDIVVMSAYSPYSGKTNFSVEEIARIHCDVEGKITIEKLERKPLTYGKCMLDLLGDDLNKKITEQYHTCATLDQVIKKNIFIEKYSVMIFILIGSLVFLYFLNKKRINNS